MWWSVDEASARGRLLTCPRRPSPTLDRRGPAPRGRPSTSGGASRGPGRGRGRASGRGRGGGRRPHLAHQVGDQGPRRQAQGGRGGARGVHLGAGEGAGRARRHQGDAGRRGAGGDARAAELAAGASSHVQGAQGGAARAGQGPRDVQQLEAGVPVLWPRVLRRAQGPQRHPGARASSSHQADSSVRLTLRWPWPHNLVPR